ncbi:SDR family NAD(P)-dependent oxidoreductase [Belnapia rosea]|nr:SDR family NAD(P)-dependent oxidoreductase [Belnapia rosea]
MLWSATFVAGSALAQSAPKPDWSLSDMPSQSRRTFLVTGGTSGLGYEDVKAMAAGTRVVISARNPQRGEETIARIRQEIPNARLQFEAIDLADLASACALSNRLQATLLRLGGLINNATIMAPPERGASANGFEIHFATNFLGHFLLTAGLLPVLRRSAPPPACRYAVRHRRASGSHQL